MKICEDCELFEAYGFDYSSVGIVFNVVVMVNCKMFDFDVFKIVFYFVV